MSARLTDYLDRDTLAQLVQRFGEVAQEAIRVVTPHGRILAGPAKPAACAAEAQILIGGEVLGALVLAGRPAGAQEAGKIRMLGLMRDVIVRLCEQAAQLRNRVEELAAMYRVTEVFAGKRNLKDVCQLAAETMVRVTGTDACSIRVLNESRTELTTIAACGLSEQYMAKGKILLSASQIDQEILTTGQSVYIADERKDPRILYKAEARREGIVSALCVPMTYRGTIEGIVRVYTRKPHEFDWFETSLIGGVAAQAASAVVNTRLYDEAIEAEAMRHQVRMAAEVQRRMIPTQAPALSGFDIDAVYVPCFELAGDFYDFIELPGDNWGLAVADVVGKGVRASLLMASARSALRAFAHHIYDLADVLGSVNRHMASECEEGDFLTLFYGVLDVPRRRLTYCSAGHDAPLLVRGGRIISLDDSVGGIIGMADDMEFRPAVAQLEAGDVLVIFTDGLPECMNFRDEIFGRQRVQEAVLEACRSNSTAKAIGKHVMWRMRRFSGLQTRGDDLTLVTIKVQ